MHAQQGVTPIGHTRRGRRLRPPLAAVPIRWRAWRINRAQERPQRLLPAGELIESCRLLPRVNRRLRRGYAVIARSGENSLVLLERGRLVWRMCGSLFGGRDAVWG